MSKSIGDAYRIWEAAAEEADAICLFHDRIGKRCKRPAVKSHSLQRHGPLSSISDAGHVLTGLRGIERLARRDNSSDLVRVGVKKASTFLGFCEAHDSSLFRDVESGYVSLDRRTALLFAIRAECLEHRKKKVMVKVFDRLIPYVKDIRSDKYIEYLRLARREAERAVVDGVFRIRNMFGQLHKGISGNFLTLAVRFDLPLDFAITGSFEPDADFSGRGIFLSNPLRTKWNTLSFFAGNCGGEALSFLTGWQRYERHRVDRFF